MLAKAGKKVRVLLIDGMLEDRWSKSIHFPERDGLTDIEYFEKHQPVTGAKVFIGNHANAWSLEHYPPIR